MSSEGIIQETLEKRYAEIVRHGLEKYYESEQDFDKLYAYMLFLEVKGLDSFWWKSYVKTKYKLKEIALRCPTMINGTDSKRREKIQDVFYRWLKVCVNTMGDPINDFFFETEKIDKEKEVREILFEDSAIGKIRDIFDQPEWKIRLRKIMAWFLKRYDVHTAKKIYKSLIPEFGRFFLGIDRVLPRLFVSIFIGFLPLITVSDLWNYPITSRWKAVSLLCSDIGINVLGIAVVSLLLSLIYFRLEYSRTTGNSDWGRPLRVFGRGVLYSASISFGFILLFSQHFREGKSGASYCYCQFLGNGFRFYPEIWIFFASSALLIGIFIQVFWEEKTVTEPL